MVKIAVLVPYEEMVSAAEKIAAEHKIDVVYVKYIQTVDAVNEARLAVEAGAELTVARGYQAKLIKEYTNIPVVEMRFHAQEIGLLIFSIKYFLANTIIRGLSYINHPRRQSLPPCLTSIAETEIL